MSPCARRQKEPRDASYRQSFRQNPPGLSGCRTRYRRCHHEREDFHFPRDRRTRTRRTRSQNPRNPRLHLLRTHRRTPYTCLCHLRRRRNHRRRRRTLPPQNRLPRAHPTRTQALRGRRKIHSDGEINGILLHFPQKSVLFPCQI